MKVLLVDDDPGQLSISAVDLRSEGFAVVVASNEALALRRFRSEQPDIAVVNFDLLPAGGLGLLRRIRAESRTAILVTIGSNNVDGVLRCVDLGTEDFITRPYLGQELALRIRTVLRRTTRAGRRGPELSIEVGDLRLDPETHIAARGSFETRLTPTEFRICYALVKGAEHTVPADRLLRLVGGTEASAANSLRSHICHLRRKLALNGGASGSISSVPAVGYVLRAPAARQVDRPSALMVAEVIARASPAGD